MPDSLLYQTTYRYRDRETKAKYVWLKYEPILQGRRILDVGADECHLKKHLDDDTTYWGIGLGGTPDQRVDLEKEGIPFPDNSFDSVLCLDVLEHVDNIHEVFDELCRVSRRHVIISLPNPWATSFYALVMSPFRSGRLIKYYGLPPEPPEDRHKWFFSFQEAKDFLSYRSAKNGMQIVQMDCEWIMNSGSLGWLRILWTPIRGFLSGLRPIRNILAGTIWAVLEKENTDF